jgi:hypothetical protein
LDFDTVDNRFNYGGNIYKDYDENRPFDRGVKVAQGIKLLFYSGYSRRLSSKPATNLKFYVTFTGVLILQNLRLHCVSTSWFTLGLRADV